MRPTAGAFHGELPVRHTLAGYLLDTAEFCVKAYGCDGIYLDQLASAEPFACYCAEHSHENIGEFNNGYGVGAARAAAAVRESTTPMRIS